MKGFSILFVLLMVSLSLFAQEHYYWYNNEKLPLELAPKKKYITLKDPSDTIQLKIRLLQKNFQILPFRKSLIHGNEFVQKECDWFTIVESVDSLPILSSDTAVLYESTCFYLNYGGKKTEILPTNRLYVKLKQTEDFSILENKAKEYNLTIYGNVQFMPLWYVLACTKTSNGNALQVANSLYESNLFTFSEPEFLSLINPLIPMDTSSNTTFENKQKVIFKINASNLVIRSTDDPIVCIVINGLDGKSIFNKNYPCTTESNVELYGVRGLYILTVKLNSGLISRNKIMLK